MIHNIVTDKNGDEHQAVRGGDCNRCSIADTLCGDEGTQCSSSRRADKAEVIYKRRIKIGDIKK